ncbi:MAG TPA: hypothetical protein VND64_11445 [Pirellulales bacterium]|nr:hypothetical protein [Pirellulales bacterium]
MQLDEPPRQPFQFSLKFLFGMTAATAIPLGIIVGSPLLMGTLLAVLLLSLLSIAGWLVAVDEWRSPKRSKLNLSIALWLAMTSLAVSVFLAIIAYGRLCASP